MNAPLTRGDHREAPTNARGPIREALPLGPYRASPPHTEIQTTVAVVAAPVLVCRNRLPGSNGRQIWRLHLMPIGPA